MVRKKEGKLAKTPYIRVWDGKTRTLSYQHRLIAQELLGRKLTKREVVHHIDGNPTNNLPNNIRILPSQRQHIYLENYQRREAKGIGHLFPVEELLVLL